MRPVEPVCQPVSPEADGEADEGPSPGRQDLGHPGLRALHLGLLASQELDHELPKLATSCPERGYQAPKLDPSSL